jgi:diguanylate cyclase (GGDEF)-like protein
VECVRGGQEALDALDENDYQLTIIDLVLQTVDGFRLLEEIKRRKPSMDVVVVSTFSSPEHVIRAHRQGASDFIIKPFNPDELSLAIKRLTWFKRLFHRNKKHRDTLELYDACRNISACLELDRLYEMVLEVFRRVMDVEFGLVLVTGSPSEPFTVKARAGLGAGTADEIAKTVTTVGFSTISRMVYDENLNVKITVGFFEGTELMVIPMQFKSGSRVMVVLGKDVAAGEFSKAETAAASFITGQVAVAFENALAFKSTKDLNYIDDMTGLYNYRYLELVLDKEIHKAKFQENEFVLLFIDIDHFKEINDQYGHLVGRMALIEFGKVLRNTIREFDILVRYGGDEFIVLAKVNATNARAMSERILAALRKHRFLGREGKDIRLTASIGIAVFPHHAKTTKDLIDLADKAMYYGKEAGRDCVYSVESLMEKGPPAEVSRETETEQQRKQEPEPK